MKVLIVHNAYQLRGGEDAVVDSEAALLAAHGHQVLRYQRSNDDIAALGTLQVAADTFWSRRTGSDVRALLQAQRPDVVHVHNTLPLVSPSLYWCAAQAGIPVVQTLHNFRLMCPQAMLLRDGQVCESCVGRAPWPGVVHGCYRGSRSQTALLSGMLMLHRGLGTWRNKIALYVALNEFCRAKFVEGGLPAERLVVKPNFVEDSGWSDGQRRGLLFVGRLAPEKGVAALAEAARGLPAGSLRVAGTGPAQAALEGVRGATLLGALPPAQVGAEMAAATALVLPSIWYENFPRTLVEAFAQGLPVITSRIGALASIVEDGVTGLHAAPGDARDLAAKMQWALEHPEAMAGMGRNARRVYEQQYTPEVNYRQLMAIYRRARGEGT